MLALPQSFLEDGTTGEAAALAADRAAQCNEEAERLAGVWADTVRTSRTLKGGKVVPLSYGTPGAKGDELRLACAQEAYDGPEPEFAGDVPLTQVTQYNGFMFAESRGMQHSEEDRVELANVTRGWDGTELALSQDGRDPGEMGLAGGLNVPPVHQGGGGSASRLNTPRIAQGLAGGGSRLNTPRIAQGPAWGQGRLNIPRVSGGRSGGQGRLNTPRIASGPAGGAVRLNVPRIASGWPSGGNRLNTPRVGGGSRPGGGNRLNTPQVGQRGPQVTHSNDDEDADKYEPHPVDVELYIDQLLKKHGYRKEDKNSEITRSAPGTYKPYTPKTSPTSYHGR